MGIKPKQFGVPHFSRFMLIGQFYRQNEPDIFNFAKLKIFDYQSCVSINSESIPEDQHEGIIHNSIDIFQKIETSQYDNESSIKMYEYLIHFNSIIPHPNETTQSQILSHALDLQNPKLASLALTYLSYHAKTIPSIENYIFTNIDLNLLHQYFQGSIFSEAIFHYLNAFLKFSPHTVNFCSANNFYFDLTIDHEYYDDQNINELIWNILLIQTALISLPINSADIPYDYFFSYLTSKILWVVSLQRQGTEILTPLCFSLALCLFKMPNGMTKRCIGEFFSDIYFDVIYIKWEDSINDDNENLDYCIHINQCIAYIIYLACGFVPEKMNQKNIYKTISKKLLFLHKYNGKYSHEINDIFSLLIDGIIFCVETNSSLSRNLFEEKIDEANQNCESFASLMSLLLEETYERKNIAVRFFVATLNFEECQPYLIQNHVIQRLLEFSDDSDNKILYSLLRQLVAITQKIMSTENYQSNPWFECLQTSECYDFFQRISIDNDDADLRMNACHLLKAIFDESPEEILL